ncbi:MAG: SDR family oxidoreductase [Bacteroidetes bacterium]|nr:SDR family oxidoreductase [Bacteroidota bacterium]
MFELNHKTAVITGGGSGIGRAIAHIFAKQGASVFILDMDEAGGKNVVDEILKSGGKAAFENCNVVVQPVVRQVMQNIIGSSGYIDILINNAGIAHVGNAENTEEKDFDRLLQVNVKGMYNCLHEVIPYMKKKGGVIINMASVAATIGIPDRFAYSMTKAAVIGMTLSVAKDYLQHQIRCNCISPGRVHTPFVDGFIAKNYPGKEKEMFEKLSKTQPIGRMAKPEEIAGLALYLSSDEAAFITGCDYPIDGGFTRLNN